MIEPVTIALLVASAAAAAKGASDQASASTENAGIAAAANKGRSGPWEPTWPYLEGINDAGFANLQDGFQPYGGEYHAGLNEDQQAGLEQMRQYAGNMQGSVIDPALSAYERMLQNPSDIEFDPGFRRLREAYARETGQQLSDYILPQMQASGAGYGHRGSSRMDLARGLAGERASESIADNNASMLNNAYNQRMQQQTYALGQAGNMASLGAMPGQTMFGVGQIQQQDSQEQLNSAYQAWQANQYGELEYLKQHAGIGTAIGGQGDVRRGLPGDGYNPNGSMTLVGAGYNPTYDDQLITPQGYNQPQGFAGGQQQLAGGYGQLGQPTGGIYR